MAAELGLGFDEGLDVDCLFFVCNYNTSCKYDGGVKPLIHFHCVLHAKRREGVQIACKKNAYILNGRPFINVMLYLVI